MVSWRLHARRSRLCSCYFKALCLDSAFLAALRAFDGRGHRRVRGPDGPASADTNVSGSLWVFPGFFDESSEYEPLFVLQIDDFAKRSLFCTTFRTSKLRPSSRSASMPRDGVTMPRSLCIIGSWENKLKQKPDNGKVRGRGSRRVRRRTMSGGGPSFRLPRPRPPLSARYAPP
jgi:hypothetical protein